jgi:predicted kinase
MATITFTVGAPGAGKTSWAHEEVTRRGLHEVQRVSLDDLLTMAYGRASGELTSNDLKLAQRILISTVRQIVESGRDVIVDNTHLSTRFPSSVRDELGDGHHYQIKDFTDVPLETCILRDRYRAEADPHAYVGRDAVAKMHAKGVTLRARFGGPGMPLWADELNQSDGIEPYEPDKRLPKALIVDIDGTLALHVNRGPYDTSRYETDELERRLARILSDLHDIAADGYYLLLLTGRYEEHRAVTSSWLSDNRFSYDELHMRSDGDHRRDNVIKLELFDKHVRDRFNVIAAFDDRDRVVRLWRRLGLLTCQVQYGDF